MGVTRKEACGTLGNVNYIPLDGKPLRLTLGLRALDPGQWIEIDTHRASEMRQKADLLRNSHADVVATQPDGLLGSRELWNRLSAFVVERFPEFYTDIEYQDGHIVAMNDVHMPDRIDVREMHPIDACGRIVQEDVVLMRKRGDEWILVAASLCFPSRWRLADKIGKGLTAIHGPVPGYESQIAQPVEFMFDKIAVDRPMWRLNWTLMDDATLYQPDVSSRWRDRSDVVASGVDLGQALHFRVERQTLTKLPLSGDMVFTIRTYVRPLADLGGPEAYANLATALETAEPGLVGYKGWTALLEPTLDWLRAASR